ncbi:hypothetical protein C3I27_04060 [Campylobacter jejuni]|uniref:Transglycosylase SLT domain-containing protein n=1 Tax=Campylobacter jejuni TaxID=197 RepID=A0AAX1Z548_CAMJU|nr:hypothetical protein C3I27_04060 [Campylobacter jejuni]
MTIIRLLLVKFLLLGCSVMNAGEFRYEKLNLQQVETMIKLYQMGKPYDLGLTLIAIGWEESRLGEYPVNIQDPSCGITHIHLKTYMKMNNLQDTPFLRNKYCSQLIDNPALAIQTSINLLLYWKDYHKGDYSKMIKSYNAGFKTEQGKRYYTKIQRTVQYMKSHVITSSGVVQEKTAMNAN